MYLIAGSTWQCDWRGILALLESAGCSIVETAPFEEWCHAVLTSNSAGTALDPGLKDSVRALLGKASAPAIFPVLDSGHLPVMQHWLNEFQDGYMLLLYSRPEPALVEAMEQNRDPDEALGQWRDTAQMLMDMYRRNSGRSLLADARAALAEPDSFLAACKERFGLSFDPGRLKPFGQPSSIEMHKVFATQFIRQTPGLAGLLDEMDASSLFPGGADTMAAVNFTRAYKDFGRFRVQQLENRLKNLERENEQLLFQLQRAREDARIRRQSSLPAVSPGMKSFFPKLKKLVLKILRFGYRHVRALGFLFRDGFRKQA